MPRSPLHLPRLARCGFGVALLGLLIATGAAAQEQRSLRLSPELEVPVAAFPARGERLLLWLPSEHGLPGALNDIAAGLARRGVETWLADLLAARFLPTQSSSLGDIPPDDVADLIEAAHAATGKRIYLLASSRGAALALEGARAWQLRHPGAPALAGAVLLHPNLYVQTPEPGNTAQYRPIAAATNLPLYVLQPALSPWRWQIPTLLEQLGRGGASVYLQRLPEVRDRFHFRPDSGPAERRAAARLDALLARRLPLLDAVDGVRHAARLPEAGSAPEAASAPARAAPQLRPYRGDPAPPPLALPVLGGGRRALAALHGRVVLVNFWASWCPPCVHEMPSMQRLAERFKDAPFEILAVNMAEAPATVRTFLREKVRVDFPILLDRDGAALRRWRVFAFPTSYLIDAQGRIRFAVFGGVDWTAPAVIGPVRTLLGEAAELAKRRGGG